ncbi:MAG: FUSC family protein [Acidimicrobiales bacterium]
MAESELATTGRRIVHWLQEHDRGYAALRRAARTAIIMPSLFAISFKVLDNATIALFASFGSIGLLMLVDFGGPMRNRLEAQVGLSVTGAVLICVATLVSQSVWTAALLMAVVAFAVIFAGVVSSIMARSTTTLLLAFILSASIAAPASSIPDRLAGWGLASGAAFLAVWLLWPAPSQSPLRASAAAACRALAVSLFSAVSGPPRDQSVTDPPPDPSGSVASLQRQFLATPWRPTGLSAADRAIVRLMDEITWLNSIVTEVSPDADPDAAHDFSCKVQLASARVLNDAAALLESGTAPLDTLASARRVLSSALTDIEVHFEGHLSLGDDAPKDDSVDRFLSSLEFSFRSREIGYASGRIATDVELAVTAERRRFFERVLGQEPDFATAWASARARFRSHFKSHSVWLHNSIRGAIGLSIAVLVAEETGVQHAFWVILGALSVLRSNALNTGQNALRAVGGTIAGFVIGAALVALIGTNLTLLWFILPIALLVAGFAPTAISFAAGQAGFTLTLVILYNILEPVGWRVGLVRVEDVAIGCAVSAGVALLFWPRGAGGEFGVAMRSAYAASVAFLAAAAVESGESVRVASSATSGDAERAAAASRRLDDAFRTYLAERGAKPVPLADVTTLVKGVATLRLCAEAIVDRSDRVVSDDGSWRAAHERLRSDVESTVGWYEGFAERFAHDTSPDTPTPMDDSGVTSAVRDGLLGAGTPNVALAVKILWIADQLSIVQQLEPSLERAARAAEGLWAHRQGLIPGVPHDGPGGDRQM